MDDDAVPLALRRRGAVGVVVAPVRGLERGAVRPRRPLRRARVALEVALAAQEQRTDVRAQAAALRPAAVGEGRVVGRGRGEVPLRVSRVEAGAMPALPSILPKVKGGWRTHRTTMMTAGGFFMVVYKSVSGCYMISRKLLLPASDMNGRRGPPRLAATSRQLCRAGSRLHGSDLFALASLAAHGVRPKLGSTIEVTMNFTAPATKN